jgi:hypothetical protein
VQPAVCIDLRPFRLTGKYALRPRSKKPGAASRPSDWRSFGEYFLLEDSRYTSQEGREICSLNLLQLR